MVVRGWLHKQVRTLRREGGEEEIVLAALLPCPGPPGTGNRLIISMLFLSLSGAGRSGLLC